jgi:hypothetical protein
VILAGVHLSDDISLGDLLVAVGTFLLAVFTAYLAWVTSRLDKRTAEREERRQERRVRGVARIMDGELETIQRTIEQAQGSGSLLVAAGLPHAAWNRDGALIAETLPLNGATEVIRAFEKLKAWENVLNQLRGAGPAGTSLPLNAEAGSDLADLLKAVERARANLHELAYPNPSGATGA